MCGVTRILDMISSHDWVSGKMTRIKVFKIYLTLNDNCRGKINNYPALYANMWDCTVLYNTH